MEIDRTFYLTMPLNDLFILPCAVETGIYLHPATPWHLQKNEESQRFRLCNLMGTRISPPFCPLYWIGDMRL